MLPALVLFRPKGRDLQGRGAFLILGFLIPSDRNVIASLAFFMPIRDAFPTIHTNLWNPVASCRPCVLSPSLRIAPAPEPGAGGIGMFRRLRHGTGRRVLPRKKANPAFQSQLTNPACKVGPLKSGLAVLLRMDADSMFARHLRDGFSSLLRGRFPH